MQLDGRKLLFLIGGTIGAGAGVLLASFALYWGSLSPPVGDSGALSALDYWAHRYQSALAAAIALLAGVTLIVVTRMQIAYQEKLEGKRDEAQRRDEDLETVRSLRVCQAAIESAHTLVWISIEASLSSGSETAKEVLGNRKDFYQEIVRPPAWLGKPISRLPTTYAALATSYFSLLTWALHHAIDGEESPRPWLFWCGTIYNVFQDISINSERAEYFDPTYNTTTIDWLADYAITNELELSDVQVCASYGIDNADVENLKSRLSESKIRRDTHQSES